MRVWDIDNSLGSVSVADLLYHRVRLPHAVGALYKVHHCVDCLHGPKLQHMQHQSHLLRSLAVGVAGLSCKPAAPSQHYSEIVANHAGLYCILHITTACHSAVRSHSAPCMLVLR